VAGDGPALVVVDYVGLVDAGKRRDGDQVSATSKALKALATQLRLPVLLCAQLNRGVEMREDLRQKKRGKTAAAAAAKDDPQRPRLSDLRDSGSLEQDADAVLFLYGMERGKSGWCKIAVEKQRQGPTGDAMLWFEAGLTRFQGEEHG
jgi:replicative DNA helicase